MSPSEPETPEDRKARHLRILQELTELGMGLARVAAIRAQQNLATEAAPAPEPTPTPTEHPEQPSAPHRKPTDPGLLFARLCSAIRQTVALEARIAAGEKPQIHRPPPDARRDALDRVFNHLTERLPNRSEIRQHISERLDQTLAEDPGAETLIQDHFEDIREELGIPLDLDKLPDTFLDLLCSDQDLTEKFRTKLPPPSTLHAYLNGTGPPP